MAMHQVSLCEYRDQLASLVTTGQYAAALRVAEHILLHYPDYVEGHRLLGQALLGAGRLLDAAEQFTWVLGCDPEDVAARLGLARVYRMLDDPGSAVIQSAARLRFVPH